ncbi:hypothetical protein AYO20_05607 [Fonsecaea nubica]|uniref:DUF1446 domain-containing protein n=1 Tax=Fonsecaea nubica TaxID=856822 RepID=A0A178CZ14_9EURO|nr:hypothetical protein AYO20_05607 [Fonsecaea nubica]OAL35130.1 hypothetical protein AYO20_05607 [Fonsecaea nubica]
MIVKESRWDQRGKRPARIANVSGARTDPGYHMRRQAEWGDVDFLTGDYLAEINLPENKKGMDAGLHDGWEPTCWDGFMQTIDLIAQKELKVIVNGGALNPGGLAAKVQQLVNEKGYSLKVAYLSGDDLTEETKDQIARTGQIPAHLDSNNPDVKVEKLAVALQDYQSRPVITSHAYLGARGIVGALDGGADIVIAGRVADASPVIAAAWYWHQWKPTDYDQLASALIAGHLIECSAYTTGANFAGFDQFDLDLLVDLPFGIAEVAKDGTAVITKHENTEKGVVNADTIKCQFLYEIQGAIYLNSDVSADTTNIVIRDVGKNRVEMSGIKGYPPPPTTKLAVFYDAGYQCQLLANAAGYATDKKWQLFEKQMRFFLNEKGVLDQFDHLEFQIVGVPEHNPRSQLRSTTYCRVFAQAPTEEPVAQIFSAWADHTLFPTIIIVRSILISNPGLHWSLDYRTAHPKPYISFYPGLYDQTALKEAAHILGPDGKVTQTIPAKLPAEFYHLERRINFDATPYTPRNPAGPTRTVMLGDIAYGRSGDKGANCNFGIYPRNPAHWDWFRGYMSRAKLQELIGDDWRDSYFIERMEFPEIKAVHFVVYGILGRGVLASTLLDSLGKAFADYIRAKTVDVPVEILEL